MTARRIYIRGDLGDLLNLKIFNADTDQPIEVSYMKTPLHPKSGPQATLYLNTDPYTPVFADIVPAPPVPHAGKVLREVELTREYRASPPGPSGCTITRATVTEWDVQPDGTVKANKSTRAYQQHMVDDMELAHYRGNPDDLLRDSARQVLSAIANFLISPLLSSGLPPLVPSAALPPVTPKGGPPPTYIHGPPPPLFKPDPLDKFYFDPAVTQDPSRSGKSNSNSKAVCSECSGTGEYISQITNQKSDCSQGCKRPQK